MKLLSTQDTADSPAILSCSPRPGGNSDHAAKLFARGVGGVMGAEARVEYLRRFRVEPCVSCYRCKHDPRRACYLSDMDHSGRLFSMLMNAPYLFLSSPIYYYHVPAQFKAWIDRSQCHFIRKQDGDQQLLSLPRRKAYVCLIAGRSQGDKLFEGSLLTLKYFLNVFNFEMQEPLLLKGLDESGALERSATSITALEQMGRFAAEDMAEALG